MFERARTIDIYDIINRYLPFTWRHMSTEEMSKCYVRKTALCDNDDMSDRWLLSAGLNNVWLTVVKVFIHSWSDLLMIFTRDCVTRESLWPIAALNTKKWLFTINRILFYFWLKRLYLLCIKHCDMGFVFSKLFYINQWVKFQSLRNFHCHQWLTWKFRKRCKNSCCSRVFDTSTACMMDVFQYLNSPRTEKRCHWTFRPYLVLFVYSAQLPMRKMLYRIERTVSRFYTYNHYKMWSWY